MFIKKVDESNPVGKAIQDYANSYYNQGFLYGFMVGFFVGLSFIIIKKNNYI